MIDAAKVVPDAILMGGVTVVSETHALANSLGILIEDASTAIGMGAMGIIRRGGDVGSFQDWDQGRSLKDVKPEEVGEKTVRSAEKYLKAKKVETGTFPIVFGFMPSFSLLASTLAGAANAESIQRDRSFLVGKLGQKIASELVTIIDDGTVPGGIVSSTYDSEGVPKRKLTLIDRGMLKTYLHNSYTANKAKVESTANAVRVGYASSVGIGPSNLQIKPGEWKLEEMIEDMKEGIYFETGSVYGDPVTGDVSKPVDFGFKVEKGEIAYPLKATLIGTNLAVLLRGFDAVSREYREEPGLIMPALRAQSVRVAGAK
jgi:PmbA protein